MAHDYSIDWVGQQTRPWESQHGTLIDYTIALAGEEGTVKLTQKPDTPAPVVGNQLHGRIETKHFTKHDGESFEVRKFVKEQREDGTPRTVGVPVAGNTVTNNMVAKGSASPTPEFWAAKDRRLARAGMTQAVVSATSLNPVPFGVAENRDKDGELDAYVKGVATIVDALLVNLEHHTPSPNQTSPATLDPPSGGSAGEGAETPEPAGEQRAAPNTAPAPDLSDLKLALAACGHDNANPEKTFEGLNPDEKAQVKVIVQNLKSKAEVTLSDDESIPF